MVLTSYLLLLCLVQIRGDYDDEPLSLKDIQIKFSLITTNGSKIDTTSKGIVRIYKKKGKPKERDNVFNCAFNGDEGYEELKEGSALGCVAVQVLQCDTISYGLGLIEEENRDLCWMGSSELVCAVKESNHMLQSVVPLFKSLQNHREEVAKCASKMILNEYAKKKSKEPDLSKETSTEMSTATTKGGDGDNTRGKRKKQGRTVMWNETSRTLTIIGGAACLLLFLQIIVLAMAIKLIKRQAYRGV
ncbi:hypothetical protein RB195_010256 [Necator americanus]|uniref:Uncharacterized protein n=1 Tax=Necator americanus TaxID=51031 RepID=A0ABR1CX45_NECAM